MSEKEPLIDKQSSDGDKDDSTEYEMTIDEILYKTGPFGRYQLLVLIICMVLCMAISFQPLLTYYTADDSPWVCTNENISDFCSHGPFKEGSDLFTQRCNMKRNDWKYVFPKQYSIVTEYDLVCSQEYLKALVTSCFFIGCCIGAMIGGPIADLFGRKLVIILSLFISFVSSLAGYFVTATWQYLILRVLIGLTFGKGFPCLYIYLSENMAPRTRNWVMHVYAMAYSIATLILSLICYYVPFWRRTVLYTSALPLIGFILSFFLLESPHWLAAKEKLEKAEKILQRITKINNKQMLFKIKTQSTNSDTKKYSFFHLFNNFTVLKLTIFQSYIWLAIGLVFYGIALESSNLGGNMYTNFVLSTLVDFPAGIISVLATVYISRRRSVTGFLLFGGLTCGAIGLFPPHMVVGKVIFAMSCKMFVGATFGIVYLWSFEINPTVVRSQGMNVCQFFSKLGSIAAPFFTSVLQSKDPKLPFFVMGGFAVLGSFLAMFLPETRNKPTRKDFNDYFEKKCENVPTPVLNMNLYEHQYNGCINSY